MPQGGRRVSGRGGRGGRNGAPQPRRGGLNETFVGSSNIAGLHALKGPSQFHFSLREEARNTECHQSPQNPNIKLRHSRVMFISAGTSDTEDRSPYAQVKDTITNVTPTTVRRQDGDLVEPSSRPIEKKTETSQADLDRATEKLNLPQKSLAKMSLQHSSTVKNITINGNAKAESDSTSATKHNKLGDYNLATDSSNTLFFTDVNGFHNKIDTGLPPPTMRRSVSPALSESSDEIILFFGRSDCRTTGERKPRSLESPPKQPASKSHPKYPNELKRSAADVINDPINRENQASAPVRSVAPTKTSLDLPASVDNSVSSREKQLFQLSCQNAPKKRGYRSKKATEEDKILADYIANIRAGDDVPNDCEISIFNERELGGLDGWQDEEEATASDRKEQNYRNDANDWSSADLEIFDDMSTSSEELHCIKEVLAKRHRRSGIQYLVFGEAQVADDARWLRVGSLTSPSAATLIQRFELQQAECRRLIDGSDESYASSSKARQVDLDYQGEVDDIEDEKDLEQRRKARMTDEKIAVLLSKQEELGMGSNDLVLFDGYGFDSADDQAGLSFEEAAPSRRHANARTKKRVGANFPSAAAFADVLNQDPYNGFDVMDQARPSLRKRPKGRRGKLSTDLSDSELEQTIQMAWENDRTKKKVRKQEREKLRPQGLLGVNKRLDLKAKYSEGMSMAEVKSEIKDFLLSSAETLPLPPMAQAERKMIHEIANIFSLKSKSVGVGRARFPILYRTSRTKEYTEASMPLIDSLLNSRRFLPRMQNTKIRGTPAGRARGGGFGGTVSYREGEIVGAAAPELGQENRGRAMLEKMGWSTGTALGALNNKGITQPVTQIVKISKAGLG